MHNRRKAIQDGVKYRDHHLNVVIHRPIETLSRGRLEQACLEAKAEFGRDLTLISC